MSKQAQERAPRKVNGTIRIFICEEAFDIKIGTSFIAVTHPVSKASFAVETPHTASGLTPALAVHDHGLEIKKAIWEKFSSLRAPAAQAPLIEV
jgi:hypothetical protein